MKLRAAGEDSWQKEANIYSSRLVNEPIQKQHYAAAKTRVGASQREVTALSSTTCYPTLFHNLEPSRPRDLALGTINELLSKLKWTKIGEFNSDDHYIYYCGQESHRRNGVALTTLSKRVQNAILWYNLKNDRMILAHFEGKPFNITVIHV